MGDDLLAAIKQSVADPTAGLRRVERRTRLRASWTVGGVTERFFDPLLWRQHRGADRDLSEFRTLTWGRR